MSGEEEQQLRPEGFEDADRQAKEEAARRMFAALHAPYHLDFAGHIAELFHAETLHETAEYMRKHF